MDLSSGNWNGLMLPFEKDGHELITHALEWILWDVRVNGRWETGCVELGRNTFSGRACCADVTERSSVRRPRTAIWKTSVSISLFPTAWVDCGTLWPWWRFVFLSGPLGSVSMDSYFCRNRTVGSHYRYAMTANYGYSHWIIYFYIVVKSTVPANIYLLFYQVSWLRTHSHFQQLPGE